MEKLDLAPNKLKPTSPETDFYFRRFGFCGPQIDRPPDPDLRMVVVIPCYNEPALLETLEALWSCEPPACAVEVIVVVNSGVGAPAEVAEENRRSYDDALRWSAIHQNGRFTFHILNFPELPAKHAGVGLARKIGMDEALRRLDSLQRLASPIVCFDADCTCDPNYLTAVENYFIENPGSPGCSIYFEHPLAGTGEAQFYAGVTLYELHLRSYVEALRYAFFPHAFHTIGSSMAVRANAYLKQGGMNKRQAGEDFYFLHKIIPLGRFGEVNTTRVLPSPRPSDRVPFGTGRAIREYIDTGKLPSYPVHAFEDLRNLFSVVSQLHHSDARIGGLTTPLHEFLLEQEVAKQLQEMREHTSSRAAFEKRFFRWFDGFLAMKYVHYARDNAYGSSAVTEFAGEVFSRRTLSGETFGSPRDLLIAFRALQRGSFKF